MTVFWLVPVLIVAQTLTPHASAPLLRFGKEVLLEQSPETSANVSIGDVDGDGQLDFVLAKGRHWPLVDRVLLGDGKGGIRSSYDLSSVADRTYSGLLVDLDGNGSLDVVISNDTPDAKRIYLNDGKGRFRPGGTYGRAEWPTRNAAVADLNGDKRPDIIVANRGDKTTTNYFCLNRGAGRFDADCTALAPYPATTITAADFNRDGLIDLAVPHRDGGQSYVYLADTPASFPEARRIPFGPANASIRVAQAADLNRDGLTDIVSIDERTGVAVYFGQRDAGFGERHQIAGSKPVPYALTVADLNGDGQIDVVVGHVEAASMVYFNDGSGRGFTPVGFGDNKGTVYGFAVADVNRDGVLDIAAARSEAPNVFYLGATTSASVFNGRWMLVKPPSAATDVARALTVSTSSWGQAAEQMSITREHAQGSRTTTHTIGLIEGMVGGVTAFGGQPPARSEQGVRWSGDQLVFRKSTTTPNAQQYAHVVEEIEAWSLTTDNVLKLVITHTDSQGGRSELTLTYQKQ